MYLGLRLSEFDGLLSDGIQFPFYPVQSALCFEDGRKQDFTDIAWWQQSCHRKLVGTLDRLVQVAACPGQLVLELSVERTEFLNEFEPLLHMDVGILHHGTAYIVAYGAVWF